jgi:hypothetical protein
MSGKKQLAFFIFFIIFLSQLSADGNEWIYDTPKNEFGISLGILGIGYENNNSFKGGAYYGRVFTFMFQSKIGLGFYFSPFIFYQILFFIKVFLTAMIIFLLL